MWKAITSPYLSPNMTFLYTLSADFEIKNETLRGLAEQNILGHYFLVIAMTHHDNLPGWLTTIVHHGKSC